MSYGRQRRRNGPFFYVIQTIMKIRLNLLPKQHSRTIRVLIIALKCVDIIYYDIIGMFIGDTVILAGELFGKR